MGTDDDVKFFDAENLNLPAFDLSGSLPPGVHDSSFSNFAQATAFNIERIKMWRQLVSFLALPMLTGKFSYAYIGGDFVSTKASPDQIAVLLETRMPYGPEALAAVAEFFAVGIVRYELVYGINLHFHLRGAPPELFDGPFSELKGGKDPAFYSKVGLARLQLNGVDSLVVVRSSIRGD